MRKGYPIQAGKETWKILEQIRNKGYSYFFTDWLDLILNSLLQLTHGINKINPTNKIDSINTINKIFQGKYNDKYMEIIQKYKEETINLFAKAWGMLYKETIETGKDIIGEIYQNQITYGEHGQFFTPEHITECMAKIVTKSNQKLPETVSDPCCGSGRFLLSAAKENPNNYFVGQDIDERCCKMAIINLWIFDLNGEIRWGDSLTNKINKRWIIRKGGFIFENGMEKG